MKRIVGGLILRISKISDRVKKKAAPITIIGAAFSINCEFLIYPINKIISLDQQ